MLGIVATVMLGICTKLFIVPLWRLPIATTPLIVAVGLLSQKILSVTPSKYISIQK
jgi:hypothetical protein